MLKYFSYSRTFAEFPDEIALCINITHCPNNCPHCSEPWLKKDSGTELTTEELDSIIKKQPGISMVGFMGGDIDHEAIKILADYIHEKYPKLKVGMYSGREYLDMNLLNCLDYYKIGSWRKPEGPVEDWWKTSCGPLKFTFSNQLMFKKENGLWLNITNRFREKQINNLQKEIIE